MADDAKGGVGLDSDMDLSIIPAGWCQLGVEMDFSSLAKQLSNRRRAICKRVTNQTSAVKASSVKHS